MRKFLIINLLFCSLFFFDQKNCWSEELSKNNISDISIIKSSKGNKLSFSLSKAPSYKVFTLENPSRLVVDFNGGALKTKVNISKFPIFTSFRSAIRENNDLRTVFTSNSKIEVTKSSIINPSSDNANYSLVIQLSPNIDSKSKNNKKYSLSPLNSAIADKILVSNDTVSNKPKIKKQATKKKISKTKNKKKIIVIDAGHGGKDPGAIGRYHKTKEKNVTLAFAREIKKYLEKDAGFKVYLTRDTDYFISLGNRVKKSQKLKADLFISIHADSAENKKATGLSIYTLSETSSDKEAAKLARKENKSDIIGGVNFSGASSDILKTLIDLSQRSTMNNSAKFAQFAIKKLSQANIKVKQNTHRFAGFRVLTAPDVPSVLIELGYLSNKGDEKKLNSVYYRRKFAKIFTKIVGNYFKS